MIVIGHFVLILFHVSFSEKATPNLTQIAAKENKLIYDLFKFCIF